MAYGNLALDLILRGEYGQMVVLKDGRYNHVPMDVITASKKVVDVEQFYDTERYRPKYTNFYLKPELIMTSEG
jgi:6-phosphofructokinase 1